MQKLVVAVERNDKSPIPYDLRFTPTGITLGEADRRQFKSVVLNKWEEIRQAHGSQITLNGLPRQLPKRYAVEVTRSEDDARLPTAVLTSIDDAVPEPKSAAPVFDWRERMLRLIDEQLDPLRAEAVAHAGADFAFREFCKGSVQDEREFAIQLFTGFCMVRALAARSEGDRNRAALYGIVLRTLAPHVELDVDNDDEMIVSHSFASRGQKPAGQGLMGWLWPGRNGV